MRLAVVGAGGIGGYVAARLVDAGHELSVVDANQAHVEAIRSRGLRIVGAASICVRPTALLPDELRGLLDVVLLAVKARDTAAALAPVGPMLAPAGCVVSLQNGLEEYRIAAAVGAARTVGAALTFGGHYVEPGVVHHGGPGSLHIGELDGAITERARQLAKLLSAAHPAAVTDRIFDLLWGKTALGAFYFGTALIDSDVIDILTDRQLLARLAEPVVETVRVATAVGVRPVPVDGFDPIAFATRDEAGIEASWEAQRRYWRDIDATRTGVWRDLNVHRRPTEVREILGPVLERAREHGLEVPALEQLFAAVEAAEARARLAPLPEERE